MIKVVILGGGNVAFHLTNQLLKCKDISLIQVYNRTLQTISYLKSKTSITNSLQELKEADIYIIAVSDNCISEISSHLNFSNSLVVHTSGALSLNDLKSDSNKGVLYFLQSFSKNKIIDFSTIPICIETENEPNTLLLNNLASSLSIYIYHINSKQRANLHIAAVFVNNFVNHLYKIGHDICKDSNVPFDILKPLITETSNKIIEITPFEAQTGPAKRGDTTTIEKHKKMLHKNQKEIYTLLTNSILELHGKKL